MSTTGVLCYIRDRGRVLLQLKASDRFGGGLWNGPGGKLLGGETPLEATVREVREETGLVVSDLCNHGGLTFYFGDATEPSYTVHIFSTQCFIGELRASDEGQLEWFPEDGLPYGRMWPDDPLWVPLLLAGRRFEGTFRLSDDLAQLISHELATIDYPGVER